MANKTPEEGQPFRIAARAMRQLGAELITSDEMAIYELIKNAFDAGSARAVISIDAPADASAINLVKEQLVKGRLVGKTISIPDALERIDQTISPDLSIEARTQIIDEFRKHSSSVDELITFIESFLAEKYKIEMKDSGCGMSATDLSDKFLVVGTPFKLITKRNDRAKSEQLLGEKGIGRLSMMRLGNEATVISKVAGGKKWHLIIFDWQKFDDPSLFLDDVRFLVKPYEEDELEVQGTLITIRKLLSNWSTTKVQSFLNKYIRRLQNPFTLKNRPYPIDILLNGDRQTITPLPKWLISHAQFRTHISFTPDSDNPKSIAFKRELVWKNSSSPEIRTWSLEDLSRELDIPLDTFQRLGPFTVDCLWFNRGLIIGDLEHSKKKILEELNVWCGGFAIYRDGFRVGQTGGMDDDWLEWDSRALKTKGFTLNRYQTIGSISISSQHNPFLVDAANRERLVSCPEQELLIALLADILVKDLRSHIDAIKQVEVKQAIEEESTHESLKKSEDSLKLAIRNFEEISKDLPPSAKPQIKAIHNQLQAQVEYLGTVQNALKLSRETRVELLELANIGLVVEIVIHELARLTQRTGELLTDLKKTEAPDNSLLDLIDNLQSQIISTNKRIRSVDIMSPSGRNKKGNYDVIKLVKTIVSGFSGRFTRHRITCQILIDGEELADQRFEVLLVRGLISQVLENLLTNSVYWLKQGTFNNDERTIIIEIDRKSESILIHDNGPGVDPSYREDIFKPYFTMRKKGKGLGLYIARELVEYHTGKLYLSLIEDEDARLRTFILDLPKGE
jgi:signal transduction histidine kinase